MISTDERFDGQELCYLRVEIDMMAEPLLSLKTASEAKIERGDISTHIGNGVGTFIAAAALYGAYKYTRAKRSEKQCSVQEPLLN